MKGCAVRWSSREAIRRLLHAIGHNPSKLDLIRPRIFRRYSTEVRTGRIPPSFVAGLLISITLAFAGCGKGEQVDPSGRERAVDEAQAAFREAELSGTDLSTGPCISESLPTLPDWVADIAHDPRESVDDEPANQCQRFRSGEAHHFVELAPDGQLIKAE
jgi:hypothetical protein